jgi:D-sedoheptulose 7-phosphate isomerase
LKNIILESIEVKTKIIKKCMVSIKKSNEILKKAVENGNKIIWCGNGGSAADAQHMAAELMGGLVSHDRRPIPSIALTTDTSFITAWSNDTNFDSIFF